MSPVDLHFGTVQGFKEEDKPNFTGSYYSHCKAICENLLQPFTNVLTLRVRMPIVADLTYQRNFITKIIKCAATPILIGVWHFV